MKLTDDDVRKVFAMLRAAPASRVARAMGVSVSTVNRIAYRQSHRHVQIPPDEIASLKAARHKRRESTSLKDRYGMWTVLHELPPRRAKSGGTVRMLRVRCGCGLEADRSLTSLHYGRSLSCPSCVGVGDIRASSDDLADDVPSWMFRSIVRGAREREIEFELDRDDLTLLLWEQDYKCALSGMELEIAKEPRRGSRTTASLDRIDSSGPYELGNVQWVRKELNLMKSNFQQAEFIEWCRRVVDFNGRSD